MCPRAVFAHAATAAALEARDGSAIVEGKLELGELTLFIDPARILDVCRFLKNELKFVRDRLEALAGEAGRHDRIVLVVKRRGYKSPL